MKSLAIILSLFEENKKDADDPVGFRKKRIDEIVLCEDNLWNIANRRRKTVAIL